MTSLRVHGSVSESTDGTFTVTYELAGFAKRETAMQVNSELEVVIRTYFEEIRGATPIDHGRGIPPWKKQ